MTTIAALETSDIRLTTSRQVDGWDAPNPDPNCSAADARLRTDDGAEGQGFGRGTESPHGRVSAA